MCVERRIKTSGIPYRLQTRHSIPLTNAVLRTAARQSIRKIPRVFRGKVPDQQGEIHYLKKYQWL